MVRGKQARRRRLQAWPEEGEGQAGWTGTGKRAGGFPVWESAKGGWGHANPFSALHLEAGGREGERGCLLPPFAFCLSPFAVF